MKNILWYWRRLGRMSAAEITYRAGKIITTQAQSFGMGIATYPLAPKKIVPTPSPWFTFTPPEANPYLAAADRILRGEFDVFALERAQLGFPPIWNRDPSTGIDAPLQFGKKMDYRDAELVGDIKYLWEPNRQLEFVTLAQAYSANQDERYLTGMRVIIESWLSQCPYLMGANWASSLELAIRLINWSLAWHVIGGASSPLFRSESGETLLRKWLDCIYQHSHFIAGAYSRYSSANNHLIGEASGLYTAACTWPLWPESIHWKDQAKAILIEEAHAQNTSDGVNREQALSYQQFVLDFLLIAGLHGQKSGGDFPPAYWQRIERMLEFVAAMMDVAGNLPMIGDADDGYVVRLSQESGFCPFRSLLATGAVLFKRDDFARKARSFDDKSRLLLGTEAETRFQSLLAAAPSTVTVPRAFPEGGYYVLGCRFEEPNEVRIVVDAGPLGYTALAAHGHADALALWMSVGGQEILVDPGTYAYHTKQVWRNYFRGTFAHNTVCVDGRDQSEIGGNFMWLRHAMAVCEKWVSNEVCDEFVGRHDGYDGLEFPAQHTRHLHFDKLARRLTVTDRVVTNGKHTVSLLWHFAERCEVLLSENRQSVQVKVGGTELVHIEFEADFTAVRHLRASEDPIAGWISRRFDRKSPTSTLRCDAQISSTREFRTVFQVV